MLKITVRGTDRSAVISSRGWLNDIIFAINQLIESDGLVFMARFPANDEDTFVLMTLENAERLIRQTMLNFRFLVGSTFDPVT